jgi:hypothetical protein
MKTVNETFGISATIHMAKTWLFKTWSKMNEWHECKIRGLFGDWNQMEREG